MKRSGIITKMLPMVERGFGVWPSTEKQDLAHETDIIDQSMKKTAEPKPKDATQTSAKRA